MNQRNDNRDPEAILSERLGNAGDVSPALRQRAEKLAEKFDARRSKRSNWKLIAACAGIAVFGLMFVSTKANAQFSALGWLRIGSASPAMPTVGELMQTLEDRDHQFLNYSYEGKTTMKIYMPADPPSIAATRPANEREKYSKPYLQTETTNVRTWTIRDVWRYEATGATTMSYSNNDDEPMAFPATVTFSRFPSGGSAERNMQVIAMRHPVLGLGLGSLEDPAITQNGNRLILTGRYPSTSSTKDPSASIQATATFADLEGSQLESLVLKEGKGRSFVQSYSYSDYRDFGAATVPTKITYTLTDGGTQRDLITYEVHKVDIGLTVMPPPKPWFRSGPDFVDERVNPPVRFTYPELLALNGGSMKLDSKKLLEFSKAKALSIKEKNSRKGEPAFKTLARTDNRGVRSQGR